MGHSANHELKVELLRAIKNQELVLHYQPQFNLATTQFEAVEALIRWQHPKRGLLLPAAFLSVAEESGFLVRMGEWVLRTACMQNKAWQEKGLNPIRVAVNISGKQFHQKDFVEMVMRVLEETRMKPQYLELELTENIIIHDDDGKVIQKIHRLKNLGVIITLDDFGTGYSSISHLRKFPVDRIKIDKTYIQNTIHSADDAAIVQAIIALANSLNLRVLAEGVESYPQLAFLMPHAQIEIQGFYFSKPAPAKEIEEFLLHYQSNPFPITK